MNANTMMTNVIDTIPNGDSAPHRVDSNSKDSSFSFILDNISPKDSPSKSNTSYNINKNIQNTKTHKKGDESDYSHHKKTETRDSLEDENGGPLANVISVSDINGQPDLEPSLLADNFVFIGHNGEAVNGETANIQLFPLSLSSQTDAPALVAGESMEPIRVGFVGTDEEQSILQNIPKDTAQNTPAVDNQLDVEENPDTLSLSIPTGTTAHIKAYANTDSIEGSLSDTPNNTHAVKEASDNKTLIANTSIPAESPQKSPSKAIDSFVGALAEDDGTTTDGGRKATTAYIESLSAEAKFSEIDPHNVETDSDKRASTTPELNSDFMSSKNQETTYTENESPNAAGPKAFNMNELLAQPETQSRSADNNNLRTNLEQIHIQNDPPSPMTQESFFSANNAKTNPLPDQPSPNEISSDVDKQILESIQSSFNHRDGDQQITVRLNPPELGKVFIRFQEQNSELTGLLEVNQPETRVEIEQALPQMIRDLADCGIHIKRLDIMLSEDERSGHGALENPSPQNNGSHEQEASASESWNNETYPDGINDWPSNNKNYESIAELEHMLVSDDSINVLI